MAAELKASNERAGLMILSRFFFGRTRLLGGGLFGFGRGSFLSSPGFFGRQCFGFGQGFVVGNGLTDNHLLLLDQFHQVIVGVQGGRRGQVFQGGLQILVGTPAGGNIGLVHVDGNVDAVDAGVHRLAQFA